MRSLRLSLVGAGNGNTRSDKRYKTLLDLGKQTLNTIYFFKIFIYVKQLGCFTIRTKI